MECNKEEAERCIAIGKRALEQGDYERAMKFFTKVFFCVDFFLTISHFRFSHTSYSIRKRQKI